MNGTTRKLVAVFAALAMVILAAGIARADQLKLDGDLLNANGTNLRVAGAGCATAFSAPVLATLSYNGSKHFNAGSSVTLSASASTAAGAAGISTGSDATFTMPATWTSSSPDFPMSAGLSVNVPTSVLDGTYEVNGNLSGRDTSGASYVVTDKFNVMVDCGRIPADPDPGPSTSTDTTAPTFDDYDAPTAVEATGPGGAIVDYENPTATDDSGDAPTVVCLPASGSTFVLGNTTVNCTATDAAGNVGRTSFTVTVVDTTDPTIDNPRVTGGTQGSNGWHTTDVTVTWDCSDSGSGVTSTTATGSTSGEGPGLSAEGTCTDLAGNDASDSYGSFNVDKTAPTNSVQGVTDGGSYTAATRPTPTCLTSDGGSGPDEQASIALSGGNSNGIGAITATCSGGTDMAGHPATSVSKTYTVTYGAAGTKILQPINTDNTSVFSRGKSVPVKFRLGGDEPAGFNVTGWSIKRRSVSCTSFNASEAIPETVGSTSASGLRYDAGGDQYIQNADFSNVAIGTCWQVRGELDNGEVTDWSGIFRIGK